MVGTKMSEYFISNLSIVVNSFIAAGIPQFIDVRNPYIERGSAVHTGGNRKFLPQTSFFFKEFIFKKLDHLYASYDNTRHFYIFHFLMY